MFIELFENYKNGIKLDHDSGNFKFIIKLIKMRIQV